MTAPPSTKKVLPDYPPVILTQNDVQRLLKDDSPESRVSVLEKVSEHYNDAAFAEREREIAEQIFRLLMKDAALQVRETLAERIAANPEIPRDVALHMANDVDSVALPVLEASTVLSDADLVSIVEASHDVKRLMAISKRENVSSRVSDALVETHYPQVVSTLLENDTATISERALTKIVDEFKGDPAIIETLAERKTLPITLVERLITEASDALSDQLKQKYQLSDAQIEKDTAHARDDLMLKMLRHDVPEEEVVALVDQIKAEERLTHSLVMSALCRGQLMFFTVAMARFSGIGLTAAKKLIGDKGEFGFKGIYDKAGLPDSMYEAVKLILSVVKSLDGDEAIPGSLLYANRLVERLLAAAGGKDVEYLPYFVALIRQNIAKH